jgi:Putative prokaryotic signal transducing protein
MTEHEKKDRNHPEDIKLKELVSVWGPAEAEVIKSFMESQGIPCIYKSRVVQSIHPFSMNGLGEIKIFVPEKDYETAKKILETKPENGPE